MKIAGKVLGEAWRMATSLFFLAVMIIASYIVFDVGYVNINAKQQTKRFQILKEKKVEEARELAGGYIGWISVYDTPLDHPLMQGHNNFEYLNKDPYGRYSLSGSIFLDSSNSPDLSDGYNIIYGHHMENGAMFGCLDSFKDEGYFMSHRDGEAEACGKKYKLTLFAFMDASAYDQDIFDAGVAKPQDDMPFVQENTEDGAVLQVPLLPDEAATQDAGKRDRALAKIRESASIFVEPGSGGICAFSTCQSTASTQRTVLFGELVYAGE